LNWELEAAQDKLIAIIPQDALPDYAYYPLALPRHDGTVQGPGTLIGLVGDFEQTQWNRPTCRRLDARTLAVA